MAETEVGPLTYTVLNITVTVYKLTPTNSRMTCIAKRSDGSIAGETLEDKNATDQTILDGMDDHLRTDKGWR